ncbi:MAG: hypothetical protein V3U54_08715 [Thermodesulfobacteriota bacterium]
MTDSKSKTMTVAEVEERINNLKESYKMLSTSLPQGYGSPEQTNPKHHDSNKMILKGQGRYNEVLKEIKEIIGLDANDTFAREVLSYLDSYLQGKITREEFSYSVGSWFVGDNLKVTQLMDTINDKGEEWKKLMKDPRIWYDQYWKITDPKTGESHVKPAFEHEVPYNIIKEQEQEKAMTNPHGVHPGPMPGISMPQSFAGAGIQGKPAQTIRSIAKMTSGTEELKAVDPANGNVQINDAVEKSDVDIVKLIDEAKNPNEEQIDVIEYDEEKQGPVPDIDEPFK